MQFHRGQEVWLMNPRSTWQKVASGIISDVGGEDKFHFNNIPDSWFKVDIDQVLLPDVALMWENADADQTKVGNVQGSNVVWNHKYLKLQT
jgi:hypothetical protein